MEFNIDPYYDDFQQNALDNNYMRILFKPGKAVQARELTQIQSILQNQIKQFGDHVFQDGSPVIGGNMTLDNKIRYIKLLSQFNNTDIEIDDFADRVIRSSDGTVQARVLATYYPSGGDPTLMVRYVTGNEFTDGATITVAAEGTQAQLKASQATGYGTVVSINDGVFYVDGFFVKVLNQTVVVDAYSQSANVKVGLQISDDVIDSEVDTTLLDPAQSSFNYQAPGADRYQFALTLTTRPLDTAVDESQFFELMRVENGVITKQVKYPIYAELEKTLARRTFDESGDYTVKPFRATITDGSDANNYTLAIEPGKAYVKGFEFETFGTLKIDAPKPRSASDVKSLVDVDVDISYGNYLYVTSVRGNSNGFINIAGLEMVDIHCVDSSKVRANGAHPGHVTPANLNTVSVYQNTRIGTARIKNFVRYAADSFTPTTDSNGVYKLYLTDINIIPKVLKVGGPVPGTASTINLSYLTTNSNSYANVTVTVLPIQLNAIAGVTKANVYAGSYRVNSNTASAFSGTVNVGDVIRVGDDVREVVSVNTAGDYLTVNTEFSRTIVGTSTADNPLQVFVQSPYSQNVSNQTRLITSSAVLNGNVVLYLDRAFDNNGVPDPNTVIQLNFHMDHAESFVSGPVVDNRMLANANVTMNVALQSKYLTGEVSLEERSKTAMIFPLPRSYAKLASLNNVDYNHNKLFPNRDRQSPGLFRIADLAAGESIPWADSTSSIQDNLVVIVRDNGGSAGISNGDILQLTSANVSFSGSPVNQIDISVGDTDLLKVDVIMRVKENNAETKIRKKTFRSNTSFSAEPATFTYPTADNGTVSATVSNYGTVASVNVSHGLVFLTDPTFNTVRPGDSISLFVPDVVKVRKVLMGNTSSLPDANNVQDITNRFYIDYGQRDDIYDHAKLVLKEGYDSPNGKLLVHIDFYEHIYQTGSNISFFSADSYSATQYDSGSIPVYTSSTGTTYYLRDCLDFRGTRPIGEANTEARRIYNLSNFPAPDETTELSYDHYLPRIDKLVLSKDKEFRIIQGQSATNPLPPADQDDAMTLYQINLPPYVSNINEVKMKYFENKRYTMKDISVIDKRLQRVEFFTSLNNVEKLAMADKTQYEDGTEKEKYGLVGENFSNFNIADYKSPDFNVALENGFMIPAMKVYALGFKPIANNNTDINGKTMSLNYTEVPAITQGLVSDNGISVQPFLFGQFNGTVKLTPETDYWVSETLKPEVVAPPDNIVDRSIVIRDVVVEPQPPPTLPQPTSNAVNVIITTPGSTPPPANTEDLVINFPTEPTLPVVSPQPVEPESKYLEPTPPFPPFTLEFDPWFNITPINFGISFTNGVSGYSLGNMFQNGGLFGGDTNWWASVPPISQSDIEPYIIPSNPIVSPPILTGGSRTNRDVWSGGGGSSDYNIDFDMRFMEN